VCCCIKNVIFSIAECDALKETVNFSMAVCDIVKNFSFSIAGMGSGQKR
jgi:hypothetical protein